MQSNNFKAAQKLAGESLYMLRLQEAFETGLKELTNKELYELPVYLVPAVDPSRIGDLNREKHFHLLQMKQVQKVAPIDVKYLDPRQYCWLVTREQVERIDKDQTSFLLPEQVKLVPDELLKYCTKPTLIAEVLIDRVGFLSEGQLEHLSPNTIKDIRDKKLLNSLPLKLIKFVHHSMTNELDDERITCIETKEQIESLNDDKLHLLTNPSVVPHVAAGRLKYLQLHMMRHIETEDQFREVFKSEKGIQFLQQHHARFVKEEDLPLVAKYNRLLFSGLSASKLESFSLNNFVKYVQNFSPSALGLISNIEKLKKIPTNKCACIANSNIAHLELNQLEGLTRPDQIENLSDKQVEEILQVCDPVRDLANASPELLQKIDQNQFLDWPQESKTAFLKRWEKFTGNSLEYKSIPFAFVNGVTKNNINDLSLDQFVYLTDADHISRIYLDKMKEFHAKFKSHPDISKRGTFILITQRLF